MSFSILLRDELKGFYKSNVMLFLWAGLPVMVLLIYAWYPDTSSEMPFTMLTALLVSSIGGTLGSVMLAVSIINEKNRRVYDLFLIRPIRRRDMLFAKFLAVYLCLVVASLIALAAGQFMDSLVYGTAPSQMLANAGESMLVSISIMAIASSVGVCIGVASPSVLVGAILVIYGGNQLSVIPILPSLLGMSNGLVLTPALGAVMSAVFLTISIAIFERKQF